MNRKHTLKNFRFIFGIFLISFILVLMVWGFVGSPYDITAMDKNLKFAPASLKHLMGCDNFGRDIFSRVQAGIVNTFFISCMTVFIGTIGGIFIGALTGYFGGIVDEILMRINDVVLAFPSIFLALVIIGLIEPGKWNVIVALGIAFVPSFARIVRAEFLKEKQLDYVTSAKIMGASSFRIMFYHILPNCVPVIVSSIMIGFNNAVLAEAGLSYLGIGVQPPDASLGAMLSEAQSYLYKAPGMALFPGVIMVIMILGFSLIAEGLKRNG